MAFLVKPFGIGAPVVVDETPIISMGHIKVSLLNMTWIGKKASTSDPAIENSSDPVELLESITS